MSSIAWKDRNCQNLAPLSGNPNSPNDFRYTPIHRAAFNGYTETEIVKILAPLSNNPNAPDKKGNTPIYWAAYWGYTEIVKILAPFTDNPNVFIFMSKNME